MGAETSLLIAFRRLILGHVDWGPPREEVRHGSVQQRFLLYQDFIEGELGSELDLQRPADVAQVNRFQVIRDRPYAFYLYPGSAIAARLTLIGEGCSLVDSARPDSRTKAISRGHSEPRTE